MNVKTFQLLPAALAGEYGDVFWTLEPVTTYGPGTELYTRVYVGNPTSTDREYMLMAVVSRAGTTISEFPIVVDNATWFEVQANSVITLPGTLAVGYTDATLTLNLYEKEQNDVVDSVSTELTSAGVPTLPEIPSISYDTLSSLITAMMVIMMMSMVMKMMSKELKK